MNKNLEKITSDLYVDWSEYPQNIPLTKEYFKSSNLIFDDSTPICYDPDEKCFIEYEEEYDEKNS